jgi:hypothetical protein
MRQNILRSAALEQRQADVLVGVFKVVLFIEYPYAVVENVLLYALTIHFHSVPFARKQVAFSSFLKKKPIDLRLIAAVTFLFESAFSYADLGTFLCILSVPARSLAEQV